MGVKGLWSIVSPVGVRVNPEIFTGKRIAIDVSIWLYELTYANNMKVLRNNSFDHLGIFNDLWLDFSENMNNEIKTDSLKKAHLYFFFLRICKLLYYNIRPIFVFDGNPPELKRKTIFQRSIKRRNHEERFKKTAEKLIYNYYQRTLLKSLKNKKSTSNRQMEYEKGALDKNGITNYTAPPSNNLVEIYDSIKEKDASLSSMVEQVGNVQVSVKDVLSICNDDDLKKIQNKVFTLTDMDILTKLSDQNEVSNRSRLTNDNKEVEKKKDTMETSGRTEENEMCGKDHVDVENGDSDVHNDNEGDKDENDNENDNASENEEIPAIRNNDNANNIDNEINEEIVRKKIIARKKYYENIPKNFKGFLCMRRPVDIIDISNYNTDIMEFTERLKVNDGKYGRKGNTDNITFKKYGTSSNIVGTMVQVDEKGRDDFMHGRTGYYTGGSKENRVENCGECSGSNSSYNYDGNNNDSAGEGNVFDIEHIHSSNDTLYRTVARDNYSTGANAGDSTKAIANVGVNVGADVDSDDRPSEKSVGSNVEKGKKDINILELPSTISSSNLFLDGKDEYKVYYVNNEEIKIPMFKEINKEIFEKLPIKLQYQILQDIKEEWYTDNRIKAIKSKDNMDIFSQVQLETYVRMIKTDFEIEKLKIKMAENIQNVEGELIINKELSKRFDSLHIRDYNDIKKMKKRKRKKYINDILNNCYFENQSGAYEDLYIKEEGGEKEMGVVSLIEIGAGEGAVTMDVAEEESQAGNDEYTKRHNREIDESCNTKEWNKGVELRTIQMRIFKKEETEEEKKKAFIKMENEFRKDLLLDDKEIFGNDFLDMVVVNQKEDLKNMNSSGDDKFIPKCNQEREKEAVKYIDLIDVECESSKRYRKSVSNAPYGEVINICGEEKAVDIGEHNEIKSVLLDKTNGESGQLKEASLIHDIEGTEERRNGASSELSSYVVVDDDEVDSDHVVHVDDDDDDDDDDNDDNDDNDDVVHVDVDDDDDDDNDDDDNDDDDNVVHVVDDDNNVQGDNDDDFENCSVQEKEVFDDRALHHGQDVEIDLTYEDELPDGGRKMDVSELAMDDPFERVSRDNNDEDGNEANDEDGGVVFACVSNADRDINSLDGSRIRSCSSNVSESAAGKGGNNEVYICTTDNCKYGYEDEDENRFNNKIIEESSDMREDKINVLEDQQMEAKGPVDRDKEGDYEPINRSIDKLAFQQECEESKQNEEIKGEKKCINEHFSESPHDDGKQMNAPDELIKVRSRKSFLTKEEINNLLLNKGDISNVGKEVSHFELILNTKELMDKFTAEMDGGGDDAIDGNRHFEQSESVQHMDQDDCAYFEYLEDSKVIDSYINETNKEKDELIKEYKKLKKNNIEINDEMNDDIKLLLNFFGIPYVQSPCEAEAQCSYLNNQNYCDAIISDDSDVLVFSGKTIIKNFFNRKKTVEVYEKKLIEDKLGLYQEELINISLLCGCDYTIGVYGIGIVNALEIIKAFPSFDDLKILKEIVSNPFRDINMDNYNDDIKHFLETHKNYKLNWVFPNNFPDRQVYKCFKYPKVCTDIKKFEWHFPNISHITKFLNTATNIPEEKIFNVLNPILLKYDIKVRSYQLKIEDFFPIIERKRKSVDDLIDIIRASKKGGSGTKGGNRTKGGSGLMDQTITSLIDVNPAGIIKSKRMTRALDHIKKRRSTKKKK
ncbi:DNA repair protein RAD2 [Plasmodium brasilianum]|uniref:DNA repair protein RAD2 n=1 Tax=Plasmodium brasilianum TaxID=5824 RepID=A0ACB9YEY3_PLABR|nr:DNA repair protein RAD2 [Plasmodium brasilianum]